MGEQEQKDGADDAPKGPTVEELQKASAAKDRAVEELQTGRKLPKWARDAGFESRDDLMEALKQRGTPADDGDDDPRQPTGRTTTIDYKKYLDEDGVMNAEGFAAFAADTRADLADTVANAITAREKAAALSAEEKFLADLRENPPAGAVVEGDDGSLFAALVDGILAKEYGENPTTEKQRAEAVEKAKTYIGGVAQKEAERRAAEAKAEADKEPPVHKPGGGEGAPKEPGNEKPPQSRAETIAQARQESRRTYLESRQAG